ncbi:MAG: PAS domain-containing protein, partial [Candidatus Latescibacterota bacterium]
KLAEEVLRQTEIKFEAQYRGLPIPVYTWQKQGDDFVLIDFNHAAEKITEGKIKNMVGMQASRFFADDQEILAELHSAFDQKHNLQREMLYRFKTTGATKYLRVSYGFAPPDLVLVHTEDVTERTVTEEKLRESEARLRTAVESFSFDFFMVDTEGRCTMQNSTSKELWGDLVGKRLDKAPELDPEIGAKWMANADRVLAGEVVKEDVSYTIDGKKTYFHTVLSPVYDRGRIQGLVGINIDISERVYADNALRESEEKYRFLVENVGTSVSFWAPDGTLLLINSAGARGLGSSPEALIGRSLYDFVGGAQADELMARHRRVLNLDSGAQFEDQIDLPRGRRWYRSILQPVKHPDGEPIGVQVVSHDITDLMEAERELRDRDARLRLMVKQVPAIIWTTDNELRFTSSVGAGLDALNLDPDEVVGKTLYEYFGTDDPEFLPIAMHRRSLRGEPTTYEVEWDHSIWETQTEPLRDETGEIIGCLAIALDITERKRAAEEIEKSHGQLRQLTRRLHEVREEESAAISREIHDELGQVLTGFKMDLGWIERRCDPTTMGAESDDVVTKIDQMYGEIDLTIDTVRRISAELHPRILDDMGLLGAIEWRVQEFEKRNNIRCHINHLGLGDAEERLGASRSIAVFRILTEILTNITRHAEASHVEVELRSGGGIFMLEVRDDGKGMPPDELKEPLGIGLLGMRERAQAFGGDVDFDSTPGAGTSVRVLIPFGDERKD